MLRKIGSHLRDQWMGATALFLVLCGGTAWAVDGPLAGQNTVGSEDIIGNEVKSDDIGNGRIFNLDIADEIITGAKLKNGTVSGDDVDESTLNLDAFNAAADTRDASCPADDDLLNTCASTSITIDKSSRLFIDYSGEWSVGNFDDGTGPNSNLDDPNRVLGFCAAAVDGTGLISRQMGESRTSTGVGPSHPNSYPDTFAGSVVTDDPYVGTHTVSVDCQETDGNVEWFNIDLSVATVGN